MAATAGQIYDVIDAFAPFDTQEAWDNAGLLAGRPDAAVTRVLVALDPIPAVFDEAAALGAQLLVTHHPILFHARKNLREDDPEGETLCRLIRSGLTLIAAHTNFDAAQGGVNDALAGALGLTNTKALEGGLRIGDFDGSFGALCDRARASLGTVVRAYGPEKRPVMRVAVCGGAGGSLWEIAAKAGAQAYLTGEIHHNDAIDMAQAGLCAAEAGHWETERICVKAMKTGLQNRLDALQYNVRVFESAARPF